MPASTDSNLAYQNLQPDDILTSLEHLGYSCDGHLLPLNSYENRVYRLGIDGGAPVVAKFYRPGRWSDAAILEEHAFAAELAAAEIPVVPALAHDGQTLHKHGAFRFAVFPCHGGYAPELNDMNLQRQIGRLIARIHLNGERSEFRHRPHLDLDSFGLASRDYLLTEEFIPAELETVYDGLAEQLFDAIDACYQRAGDFATLRMHGDFHPGNVLVSGEQVHIVDLDDVRTGPAVQDLWMFLSGNAEEQTPQLDELLAGYCEFRDFDARELNLIEALRTLRIMHYAAWLARRWTDPAFQIAFPWFDTPRYWDEHILTLREQLAAMQEPPLRWQS